MTSPFVIHAERVQSPKSQRLWVNPRVETLGYYRIVPTGLKTLAQDFNPGWALGGRLRRRA